MIPTDPNTAVSTLSTLYHSGAWACLAILVAFLGLRWASQHVAWLEAPARAHYVAILLGALAVVAAPAAAGTTPNAAMILSAITGAVLLLLPGAATPSKTPQQGSVKLTLVALLALVGVVLCMALPSCGAAQKAIWQSFATCEENAAATTLAGQLAALPAFTAADLATDAVSLGVATVVCAAKLAEAEIQQALAGSGAKVSLKRDARLDVLDAYIVAHESTP